MAASDLWRRYGGGGGGRGSNRVARTPPLATARRLPLPRAAAAAAPAASPAITTPTVAIAVVDRLTAVVATNNRRSTYFERVGGAKLFVFDLLLRRPLQRQSIRGSRISC